MFNINTEPTVREAMPTTTPPPNPLISIVVCTYNRAHALPTTLSSVLAQRYRPVEILVVDDGSRDETPRVVRGYGGGLRYHRLDRNVGIARARSEACRLARGQFIAFQDDDDLMPPDRLQVLWEALAGTPGASFAVGDLELVDEHGRPTGNRWLPTAPSARGNPQPQVVQDGYRAVLWPTLPVVPHTTLFRRADGERIGWFDELFRHAAEDKDFFARLARLGPVVYVPEVVSWVRRGHPSLTRDVSRTERGALELYRKHMARIAANDPHDPLLYRRLQERVAVALERITCQTTTGSSSRSSDCEERYLPLLSRRLRLRYGWRTRLRHPLRLMARRLRGRAGAAAEAH